MNQRARQPQSSAVDLNVVRLCQDLIQIDTTNTGEVDTTVGEAVAAEYVMAVLRGAGYDPVRFETTSSNRQGVYLRIPGADPQRPALLIHGHLDVVGAEASDWSVDPFSAVIADGMIWGRGAVDMKHMDAMMLAVLVHWARTGQQPPRDLVVLFLPDEEAGGKHGAHWVVDNHPEWFDGVTEAVGEVGGFSLTVRDDLRLYFIQVAEKGIAWLKLAAAGQTGHGSLVNSENAVTRLAEAITALGNHKFAIAPTATVLHLVDELQRITGTPLDPSDPERLAALVGPLAPMVLASLRHTANPTMLNGGYKANVIPGRAEAVVDGRYLPGQLPQFLAEVREVVGPDISVDSLVEDIGVETTFDGPLVDQMVASLLTEDPSARVVPYMMSGGTDAKAISTLGIRCFGFAPLQLPPGLDYTKLFHGIDERVPIDALKFGTRVLDSFLLRS